MDIQKLIKSANKMEYTRQELFENGFTIHLIRHFLKQGDLKRLCRGKYKIIDHRKESITYDDRFREATLIVGSKSTICLLSALEYYHLTDKITDTVWVMVPQEKRVSSRKITLLRSRNPHWTVGIERHRGFRITSLERTLVDCLIYHRKISKSEGIEALKKSLRQNKTTLEKVFQMAKKIEVTKRIQPILEVLM